MNEPVQVSGQLLQYRLEIRDEQGNIVKVLVGDAASNTVTVEYPDGRKEVIGALD